MMAVFTSAAAAAKSCVVAQRDLAAEPWGATGALRVRMGLRAAYETFTEGFTTADLTEARALLQTDP
jgi:hypothetical protein